jgi:hypothetical protein
VWLDLSYAKTTSGTCASTSKTPLNWLALGLGERGGRLGPMSRGGAVRMAVALLLQYVCYLCGCGCGCGSSEECRRPMYIYCT